MHILKPEITLQYHNDCITEHEKRLMLNRIRLSTQLHIIHLENIKKMHACMIQQLETNFKAKLNILEEKCFKEQR